MNPATPPAITSKEPTVTSQPTGQQPDLDAIEAVIRAAIPLGADIAPETAGALLAEVRRLRAVLAGQCAYEVRLREQHDRDVTTITQLRSRVTELERPAVEAKRNEIRQSFAELVAAAEETKDFEGSFNVQCRLREREEQWATEDAAARPSA